MDFAIKQILVPAKWQLVVDSEFQTKTASKGPLAIPILHIMVCNSAMMLVLGMSEH